MRRYVRIVGATGLSNLGVVDWFDPQRPSIYRSAQPDVSEGGQTLQELGVKFVLNLQEYPNHQEVMFPGIQQIPFRINVFSDITIDEFDLLVETMSNKDYQPLLVHCRQGHDRTGVVCGAYRLVVNGWSYKETKEEMVAYGWNPMWRGLEKRLQIYASAKGKLF